MFDGKHMAHCAVSPDMKQDVFGFMSSEVLVVCDREVMGSETAQSKLEGGEKQLGIP